MSKNLFLYDSKLRAGGFTWALMPIGNDTPIIDATFMPEEKGLLILLKDKKESFIDRPLTNDRGDYVKRPDGSYKTKEVKLETYKEHYMEKREDIQNFVETYVINYDGRDLFAGNETAVPAGQFIAKTEDTKG